MMMFFHDENQRESSSLIYLVVVDFQDVPRIHRTPETRRNSQDGEPFPMKTQVKGEDTM